MAFPRLTTDVEQLLTLVSPRVGVIQSVSRVYRGAEEPPSAVIYQARLSNFDFRRARLIERIGAGKGESESDAIASAIGEAIERYCASHSDPSAMLKAPFAAIEQHALNPTECVLYLEDQYAREGFPYHRFQEHADIAWIHGLTLPDECEVLVPASFVYLNYICERPEEYLCPITSNGLAAGTSLEAALLAGLCELIERDAFLITWMNRLPVPRVDFSDMDGLPEAIRAHYQRFEIEIQVFNITTDTAVSAMLAMAIDRSGRGPAAVVGLGCHLNPVVALKKALLEVCQVRPGETAKYQQSPPYGRLQSYQDIHTLEDHSAFFTMTTTLGELDFLLKTPYTQQMKDLPNLAQDTAAANLANCITMLERVGSRVIYVDVTTADIASLGLRVVRTIATGLQPIHFGYGTERLGGRRLYDVPHILGYTSEPRTAVDLNPCPHPLA